MKNYDCLQRFLFEDAPIRGEVVRLKQSYRQILEQHPYSLPLQKILGEALVLASLMSAVVKFEGRITIQFQGKNKLKLLLAQSNHNLEIRGLVQADPDISEDEILHDLKQGVLGIMMDPENSGTRYQGIVSWKGDSLSASIEGYFTDSEQLRTRIWFAVDEENAAGFLLQKMPLDTSKPTSTMMDDEADRLWEHLVILTDTVKPEELLHLKTETLMHRLYVEESIRLFEPSPTVFRCTCSRTRGENAILMLGQSEAEDELRDHPYLSVTCEFCNKEYRFDSVDVTRIFRKSGSAPSSDQIH